MIVQIENKPKVELPRWEHHQVYAKNFEMPNEQLLLDINK